MATKGYVAHSKEFAPEQLSSLAGYGELTTSDGQYRGQLVQDRRHGLGVETYRDGSNYQGQWTADLYEGSGQLKTADGDVYVGAFVRGQRHGFGSAALSSGEVYEGEWAHGQKQGRGLWEDSLGNSYVGEWKADEADGHGIFISADGSRYEGEFRNSMKHGQGTEKFAYGDFYVGEFANGRFEGEGEYVWANGNSFLGQFRNGVQHGFGIWKQKVKNSDGETTEGYFLHGLKHGLAITRFADSSVYKGYYFKNVRQGYGEIFLTEKKTSYRGQWVDGVQNGLGILEFDGDSSVYFGLFTNGVFVEEFKPESKPDMYQKLKSMAINMEEELATFKDEAKRRTKITKILGDTMNHIFDKKLHEIGGKGSSRKFSVLNQDEAEARSNERLKPSSSGNHQMEQALVKPSKKRLFASPIKQREFNPSNVSAEPRRFIERPVRDRSLNMDRSPPRDTMDGKPKNLGGGRSFQFYKGRTTYLDRLIHEKLKINHPSLKKEAGGNMRAEQVVRPAWKPSGLNMIQQTPLKYSNNIIT